MFHTELELAKGYADIVLVPLEAGSQLRRYLADERLARQFPNVEFKGVALLFRGWELVHSEEVAAVDAAAARL